MANNDETAFTKSKGKRFPRNMPAEAEYPFKRWKQSADNMMHFSQEEKGKVTRGVFHPSGSFEMTWPDGSKTIASAGQTTMESESSAITIRANHDVDVGGHMKTTVAGGARTEVAGQFDLTTKGATINIMGDAAVAVNGNAVIGAKGNATLDVGGKAHVKAATAEVETSGSTSVKASDITLEAGDITLKGQMEFIGDISHDGSMNTSGIHTDSIGQHDA